MGTGVSPLVMLPEHLLEYFDFANPAFARLANQISLRKFGNYVTVLEKLVLNRNMNFV